MIFILIGLIIISTIYEIYCLRLKRFKNRRDINDIIKKLPDLTLLLELWLEHDRLVEERKELYIKYNLIQIELTKTDKQNPNLIRSLFELHDLIIINHNTLKDVQEKIKRLKRK